MIIAMLYKDVFLLLLIVTMVFIVLQILVIVPLDVLILLLSVLMVLNAMSVIAWNPKKDALILLWIAMIMTNVLLMFALMELAPFLIYSAMTTTLALTILAIVILDASILKLIARPPTRVLPLLAIISTVVLLPI
jgi:hypothetical protein